MFALLMNEMVRKVHRHASFHNVHLSLHINNIVSISVTLNYLERATVRCASCTSLPANDFSDFGRNPILHVRHPDFPGARCVSDHFVGNGEFDTAVKSHVLRVGRATTNTVIVRNYDNLRTP